MKILVTQIGRYGDLILTTPLLQSLHEVYPDSSIDVLVSSYSADITQSIGGINRWIVYHKSIFGIIKLILQLMLTKYDILIDPKDHSSRDSRILASIVRAKIKVGFTKNLSSVFTHIIPSDIANNELHLHAVERNIQALQSLSIDLGKTVTPVLKTSVSARDYCSAFLTKSFIQKHYAVLNISAGELHRVWNQTSWIDVATYLHNHGITPIVLCSPQHQDNARDIAALSNAIFYPSRSINDAIALIEKATLLVSVDSAPIHIASSFNIPCIALFDSTVWNCIKFAPLSSWKRIVQPTNGHHFIHEIELEQVTYALQEWIDKCYDEGKQ